MKIWLILISACAWLAPAQDAWVPVRRAREWNATAKGGYCNFRVQIEDEADFVLNGERLAVRSTKGAARDVLTECTGPLPVKDESVRLGRILRGRGDVRLYDPPSARNNWTALIRIIDATAGPDELEFRLDWGTAEESKSSTAAPTRSKGEYDSRDLSKWRTRELREEIENIYSQLGKRRPSSDDVDDFIDLVRDKGLTLGDIRREVEKRK